MYCHAVEGGAEREMSSCIIACCSLSLLPAAPEEQQGEEVPQEVAEEEPRPQEGEGEATEEEQGKEVEPQPAEEKVEQVRVCSNGLVHIIWCHWGPTVE